MLEAGGEETYRAYSKMDINFWNATQNENHPRIKPTTNARTRNVTIRLFVKNSWTVFPHPKGG